VSTKSELLRLFSVVSQ